MNSFYIDLNEMSSKKSKIKRLLIFGALMYFSLMLASISILNRLNSPLEWFFLIPAVYLALYIYYAWITFKADLFVKADNTNFEYKFGFLKHSKNTIIWDVVNKVKFGPTYIAFYKKSGRRKMVYLSWLPYAKVVEIKEKLMQLCDNKMIKYEVVDFIRYAGYKNKKKNSR